MERVTEEKSQANLVEYVRDVLLSSPSTIRTNIAIVAKLYSVA